MDLANFGKVRNFYLGFEVMRVKSLTLNRPAKKLALVNAGAVVDDFY